jgi:guanosine-3',5'-bis(diphosphate) 3'-pyrophosphohydrolase
MGAQQKEDFTHVDPAELLKAIAFASDKHRHQRRKDAEASPYINHPIAVANVLAGEGGISDEVTLLNTMPYTNANDSDKQPPFMRA